MLADSPSPLRKKRENSQDNQELPGEPKKMRLDPTVSVERLDMNKLDATQPFGEDSISENQSHDENIEK